MFDSQALTGKTALITGGAARLGAASARFLHAAGAHVVIHYRHSSHAAQALHEELEARRPNSTSLFAADLLDFEHLPQLIEQATQATGRLDILLNNASNYFPTPLERVQLEHWEQLFGVNAKAPFFLSVAAAEALAQNHGCIINMVDIHAERPNPGYPIYSMAKAANAMMVKSLARELAPRVRVNGIAPGAILWPEHDPHAQANILPRIPLGRAGLPEHIAHTVLFLATSEYITGQIIAVDGGRTIQQ